MPKFAANLSMLYPERPFLDRSGCDRFAAAAKDGFKGVEFLFPYAYDKQDIAARLAECGLQQVLFNAPPGDFDAGERGLACLAEREAEFQTSIALALEYATALHCPRLHVMAGVMPEGIARELLTATYITNIRYAAKAAALLGVNVLIEPINTRDIPNYFLNRQDHAHQLIEAIGEPNVKVQFDLYHCQIVEGDLTMKIKKYLPTGRVGHFQIAGVPMRHEPDLGEMSYDYIFSVIEEVSNDCGWDGWVGCEYRPARGAVTDGTSAGLGWMRAGWMPS
ncbi:MAG: hydroxypyruvate isomerase family protein [Cytophagales bacterium]|nr:hydroxypyruvate isomerase family protein [Cytophagales bacterium]